MKRGRWAISQGGKKAKKYSKRRGRIDYLLRTKGNYRDSLALKGRTASQSGACLGR